MSRAPMACHDCRVDTSNATGVGHYYMVQDNVWQQATGGVARVRWLCLDCLEARLGRPLRSTDFKLTPSEIAERLAIWWEVRPRRTPGEQIPHEHTVLPERERQRWLDYWRVVPRHIARPKPASTCGTP
jgi:hypothetical protein